MKLWPGQLNGIWLAEGERVADERGWFARAYCSQEFGARGLALPTSQVSFAFNHRSATLRGMHWQQPPFEEAKLVCCSAGAVWDVVIDVRPDSPTLGQWEAHEISAANGLGIYVSPGFAHGYVTLDDATLVHYQMSARYEPAAATGLRWDDPLIGIDWPLDPAVVSARDRQWPGWREHPLIQLSGGAYACSR